jgi:hypothetical protein
MFEENIDAAATFLVGIAGTAAVLARTWWTKKTREEKKALVIDTMTALQDGKISIEEAKTLVNTHF